MVSKAVQLLTLLIFAALALVVAGQTPQTAPAANPTVWLVGDSTVNSSGNGLLGWGTPFAKLFDPEKVSVQNKARGGRSARSYESEGLWNAVRDQLKPGDFVLIQFGHNDGGNIATSTNGRPDLPGTGDETATGRASTGGREETVHTYGWYLGKFVREARERGATPILLTMVPHNRWGEDGKMDRASVRNSFVKWVQEVAAKEHVPVIDLNEITARRLEKETREAVTAKYFTPPNDGTHTNAEGAKLNAESVVMGLRALPELSVNGWLSEAGKALEPARASEVRPAGVK